MKNTLIVLTLTIVMSIVSCSKHDHHKDNPAITQDINVELLAGENYQYSLPLDQVDDMYFFAKNSTIAQKSVIENFVFNYTAPATITPNTTDEVVISNDHKTGLVPDQDIPGASKCGVSNHYTINFHVKFVGEKPQ